jgi:hypothetical protein
MKGSTQTSTQAFMTQDACFVLRDMGDVMGLIFYDGNISALKKLNPSALEIDDHHVRLIAVTAHIPEVVPAHAAPLDMFRQQIRADFIWMANSLATFHQRTLYTVTYETPDGMTN